jgi:UDP-N-acetylmuramyl pentapeptide synthase
LLDAEFWPDHSRITLMIDGRPRETTVRIVGPPGAAAVTAAVAATCAAGLDLDTALRRLADLVPTPRRLQPVLLPSGAWGLLDDYKCTPATAHAAFDVMTLLASGRRVGVLGNIPRSTSDRERVFRELGQHAGRVFDRIYLTCLNDQEFDAYRDGILQSGLPASEVRRLGDVHEAARVVGVELTVDDVVLFKAHFTDKLSRTVLLMKGVPVRCRRRYCLIRASSWCDACPLVYREVPE